MNKVIQRIHPYSVQYIQHGSKAKHRGVVQGAGAVGKYSQILESYLRILPVIFSISTTTHVKQSARHSMMYLLSYRKIIQFCRFVHCLVSNKPGNALQKCVFPKLNKRQPYVRQLIRGAFRSKSLSFCFKIIFKNYRVHLLTRNHSAVLDSLIIFKCHNHFY